MVIQHCARYPWSSLHCPGDLLPYGATGTINDHDSDDVKLRNHPPMRISSLLTVEYSGVNGLFHVAKVIKTFGDFRTNRNS